ncbi:uncharacterized protein PG986_002230 [Apiospora aurea]|uniref:Uncharacterized protein n=1 Tax=Apiospora aurea TaxID=335848 RepID=A0ABR1QZV4_9PEZI
MAAFSSVPRSAMESIDGPSARLDMAQTVGATLDGLGDARRLSQGKTSFSGTKRRAGHSVFFVFELLEQGGKGSSDLSSLFSRVQYEEPEETVKQGAPTS